jgi:predicted nucleic acid-binding protein
MAFLLDTNILLRSLQPHHPHCSAVERALTVLRTRDEGLHIAAQNLIEFWAVATRPQSENGLVAVMKVHGITSILTFNVQDFTRYEGIAVVHPDTLA